MGRLEQPRFAEFIQEKFRRTHRPIPRELVHVIMGLAGELPGDVQQFCSNIWEALPKGKAVTFAGIQAGLERVFQSEIKACESIMIQITAHQQNCLRQLARHPEWRPYQGPAQK